MTDPDDGGTLVPDALTAWLNDHPSVSDVSPDLVALAQYLAGELEVCKPSELAALAREYRMVLKELRLTEADDGEDDLGAAMRTAILHPKDA